MAGSINKVILIGNLGREDTQNSTAGTHAELRGELDDDIPF